MTAAYRRRARIDVIRKEKALRVLKFMLFKEKRIFR